MFLSKLILGVPNNISINRNKASLNQLLLNGCQECFWLILKGAQSCSFALSVFVVLAISKHLTILGLPRYDFILLMLILVQASLILFKQESLKELKVICIFHVLGFILEYFKTQPDIGSWVYPELAYSKIAGVPLYSGFMYSAVASFLLQMWRRCSVFLEGYPSFYKAFLIAGAIYLNFFTHHFVTDVRWWLMGILVLLFWQTRIYITPYRNTLSLSVPSCLVLCGLLLWVAENIATYFGAWAYPNQLQAWEIVHWGKVVSWSLLMVVTFVVVAQFKLKNLG
ncbi:DUF817 family protein [Neisseria sp. Ec49-e6-T10]|uniref:DUF817 family protein n=1 Tax=Neisseria sp. Ec49-e6-T10 TaxID=3140744 RepID=UPI003EBF381D